MSDVRKTLASLRARGIVPTMTSDELMKLTRGEYDVEDTDWRPSKCPGCGNWRAASPHPVCTSRTCGRPHKFLTAQEAAKLVSENIDRSNRLDQVLSTLRSRIRVAASRGNLYVTLDRSEVPETIIFELLEIIRQAGFLVTAQDFSSWKIDWTAAFRVGNLHPQTPPEESDVAWRVREASTATSEPIRETATRPTMTSDDDLRRDHAIKPRLRMNTCARKETT